MSTIAGRWDDYSLEVAIDRHFSARCRAEDRCGEIEEQIKLLKAELAQLEEVAERHKKAQYRLVDVRKALRKQAA